MLNEARGSVRGVEFGPNAFGLKLVSFTSTFATSIHHLESPSGRQCANGRSHQASISTDATLRIYTSISPTLTDWQVTNSISVPSLVSTSSNNPADGDSSAIYLPGQQPSGASSSTSGSVGGSGFQQSLSGAGVPNPGKGNEALGGWTVSWCKEKWWGSVLAVSSGHSGIIKVSTYIGLLPRHGHAYGLILFSSADRLAIIGSTLGSTHPPTSFEQLCPTTTTHPKTQLARRTGYYLPFVGCELRTELSPDREWA